MGRYVWLSSLAAFVVHMGLDSYKAVLDWWIDNFCALSVHYSFLSSIH